MESKYKHLFSPILVNQTMLPNRIMAAPILRHISREKATSGIGTIIWGSGFIDDEYAPIRSGGYVFDPYAIQDSVRQKLDMYKQGGAKVSIELMHCGARGRFCYKDYKDPFGSSEYVRPDGSVAHPMNEEEMNRIADKFAEAAVTAKQLGFDMVMIHCAHGWLIHQFLSPKYNPPVNSRMISRSKPARLISSFKGHAPESSSYKIAGRKFANRL